MPRVAGSRPGSSPGLARDGRGPHCRGGRLLGSPPFGEVQDGATLVHVALNPATMVARCSRRRATLSRCCGRRSTPASPRPRSSANPTAARSSGAGCCGRDRTAPAESPGGVPSRPTPTRNNHRRLSTFIDTSTECSGTPCRGREQIVCRFVVPLRSACTRAAAAYAVARPEDLRRIPWWWGIFRVGSREYRPEL